MLFEDQASGSQRRLTDYIIVSYFVYLMESQNITLSIPDFASAFVAQVLADVGVSYSGLEIMKITDYVMRNGFMEPTAVPRCIGSGKCWNIQEGDGYCTLDTDCQQHLKCGSKNCMDFADTGSSEYYKEGGWADGGNCCFNELMFPRESVSDISISLYLIIAGGALILFMALAMVYVCRRPSDVGEPDDKTRWEHGTTELCDRGSPAFESDSPKPCELILMSNSEEGVCKPKDNSLPYPMLTPNQGTAGENLGGEITVEAEGHVSPHSSLYEVSITDVTCTAGSIPRKQEAIPRPAALTLGNVHQDDIKDEDMKNKSSVNEVNSLDREDSKEEINREALGDIVVMSKGTDNLITQGEPSSSI